MSALVYVRQDANVATGELAKPRQMSEVPPYSLQHTYRLFKQSSIVYRITVREWNGNGTGNWELLIISLVFSVLQTCCKGHRGGNEEALAMQWLCNEGEESTVLWRGQKRVHVSGMDRQWTDNASTLDRLSPEKERGGNWELKIENWWFVNNASITGPLRENDDPTTEALKRHSPYLPLLNR